MRTLTLAALVAFTVSSLPAQQCGGEERWGVKMGADPGAAQIDVQNPVPISLFDLVRIGKPSLPTDDLTRTPAERSVHVVDARLVKFKLESGKKGDADFHLVISDETLLYSQGQGAANVSDHSVIAEIPDPACVGGRHGTVTTPSRFATQLAAERTKFLQRFPNMHSGWNEAEGLRVRLTGVVFFDKEHGQTGRARNGLELHPLLDIEFEPTTALGTPPPAAPPPSAAVIANGGFENGAQPWTATAGAITTDSRVAARTGTGKAWLGGMGETHTDRISQAVTLPAGPAAVSLSFHLLVETEESNQAAYDKLFVRVRAADGTLLKRLETFTNQNAGPGYVLRTFDLNAWKGQAIRIEFEAREDNGSMTSFVIDDVQVRVGPP